MDNPTGRPVVEGYPLPVEEGDLHALLRGIDRDEDGLLSLEEWAAAFPERGGGARYAIVNPYTAHACPLAPSPAAPPAPESPQASWIIRARTARSRCGRAAPAAVRTRSP